MSKSSKAAIIGASGYSGTELVSLLLRHPSVSLTTLMSVNQARQAGKSRNYGEELPQFYHRCDLEIEPLDLQVLLDRQIDVIFLATPNETSHELVPQLVGRNLKVIDLSGAYRLKDPALYPEWYGFEHEFPVLLEKAVYGLTEVNRAAIKQARLVANPGCYPTSVLPPLIPLKRAGLIDHNWDVVCDSKSGVSGAGKSPTANTHFSEVTESLKAYNIFKHRHTPEIWQELGSSGLIFTPHLLPVNRGLLSTIYVRVRNAASEDTIEECFREAYRTEPFVRLFPAGVLPEIKFTAHTNYCDIGWKLEASRAMLIIVCVIDNLVKGAAGQALQNMNVMLGVEETAGLM
jgi:N-acetyl-gamma-glutamyl-phosphate reductase